MPSSSPSLLELFWTFLRIGAMGFGGPFALVSLQEKVVVGKGWMTTEEFAESSGMAGLSPGPISSNTSAVLGYRLRGLAGGAVTYTAFHAPAIIVIIILSAYFQRVEQLHTVQGALKGVFAAVVGLLVAVGWKMGKSLIKDWKSAVVFALPLLAVVLLKANPVLVVLGTGVLGYLVFRPARRS
ncbi:MAG: chromate transporter [Mycobacterium leprae]